MAERGSEDLLRGLGREGFKGSGKERFREFGLREVQRLWPREGFKELV